MTQLVFDFSNARPVLKAADTNDYHQLPVSEKQVSFARQIAARTRKPLPEEALASREALSRWIDANKGAPVPASKFASMSLANNPTMPRAWIWKDTKRPNNKS